MWHVGEITCTASIKKQKISINTNASKRKENDDDVKAKLRHKGMFLKIIEMEITRNTQLLTNIRFHSCHVVQRLVKQIIMKMILLNNDETLTFPSLEKGWKKIDCLRQHFKLLISSFSNPFVIITRSNLSPILMRNPFLQTQSF